VKKSVELTNVRSGLWRHAIIETSGESSCRILEFIVDKSGTSSSCLTLQAQPFFSTKLVKTNSGGSPMVSG
jgi:hypothetical protein